MQLTSKDFLPDFEGINNRCDDAFNGSKHTSKSQIYQHEEEHDWPEGRSREVGHCFCKGNKS